MLENKLCRAAAGPAGVHATCTLVSRAVDQRSVGALASTAAAAAASACDGCQCARATSCLPAFKLRCMHAVVSIQLRRHPTRALPPSGSLFVGAGHTASSSAQQCAAPRRVPRTGWPTAAACRGRRKMRSARARISCCRLRHALQHAPAAAA